MGNDEKTICQQNLSRSGNGCSLRVTCGASSRWSMCGFASDVMTAGWSAELGLHHVIFEALIVFGWDTARSWVLESKTSTIPPRQFDTLIFKIHGNCLRVRNFQRPCPWLNTTLTIGLDKVGSCRSILFKIKDTCTNKVNIHERILHVVTVQVHGVFSQLLNWSKSIHG